ncbi:MAG: acyl-CoA dehydrogenase [Pseudonocardiales bacterium]|nr:acyl-CoA dehydrogenase [Pseudonocardiales bacterium]
MATVTDIAGIVDLPALREYLVGQEVGVVGELRAAMITGGRSNLTYKIQDDTHSWVLRRPPTGGLTPSAHDVGREYRIIDALQPTAVPVAKTIANCTDTGVIGAPFTIVEFVPGRVLRTQADLVGICDAELSTIQAGLIQVLVELHSVPYEDYGLATFGRPDGYVERQIRLWRRQWDHVATRELADIDRLHQSLEAAIPPPGDVTIVHGDFRVDNTLLDPQQPDRVLALVDWEMSTLGDPLTDVATMCAYQSPDFDHVVGEPAASTSPRWPDAASIAEDYAALTQTDLSNFDFYLGLAYFKLAVIAEGITARHLVGVGDGPGFGTASEAVPGLVADGLSAVGRVR